VEKKQEKPKTIEQRPAKLALKKKLEEEQQEKAQRKVRATENKKQRKP
jgi:hypothetical protein